ncbi:MAG: alanine racemase [Bdellovibrionales bacterium]|nr:alanine racemase [Bdellovibrionales bacterium]
MIARAGIRISGSALRSNYRILSKKIPELNLIPMIKADAYGHGAEFIGKILAKEERTFSLGVATMEEGRRLRKALGASPMPIIVFSDSAPWTSDRARFCVRYNLEPVFSEVSSLLSFQTDRYSNRIPAHVEFNTGMNRLGIPVDSASLIRFYPKTAFTHLSDADEPDSARTRQQMKVFALLVDGMRTRFPRTLLHFANSSAIWNHQGFPLMKKMDLARPGLSLYGIRPFENAREDGLKRVMRFTARVLNRIYLEKGESVGYGGTYRCKNPDGEWIAILGAGYADGVFRSLGNQGVAYHGSKKLRFRGRVSMDLSAVEGFSRIRIGDELELWGDRVDPYEQSFLAGTIPYEITTRIGDRVERKYEP